MEIQIGIAKVKKYASSQSGDTVEVVERPGGGLSVVMADGQRSGRGAKNISTMVTRKVIALLAEGVRDGAAARAASDYLYAERAGKVSATLNILSADLFTDTLVISRNNPSGVMLIKGDDVISLDEPSSPVGVYRGSRPVINEFSIEVGLGVVMYTDGLVHAGSRNGESIEIQSSVRALIEEEEPSPQMIADDLIAHALKLDQGRPVDDTSIVVLRVMRLVGDEVRRMSLRLPITY